MAAASEEQIQEALTCLFENYWILRADDPERYHQLRRLEKDLKRILDDRFGYRLHIHTQFIKLEKIPVEPRNWMGIPEFQDVMDYTLFACVLAFLESKEQNDYFLLSHLVEELTENYPDREGLDWTNYRHRTSLVRVVTELLKLRLMDRIEGEISQFAQNEQFEALYRVTLYARYFMRTYPEDIYKYDDWHTLTDEDQERLTTHGRRWEAYRRLMMEPVVRRTRDNSEQLFNYFRVQRRSIEEFFERMTPFSFELTRDAAMLTLSERRQSYTYFPAQPVIHDIVLQLAAQLRKQNPVRDAFGMVSLSSQEWLSLVQNVQQAYASGWSKEFREMTTQRLADRVLEEACSWQLADVRADQIELFPSLVRFTGRYSDDFLKKEREKNE